MSTAAMAATLLFLGATFPFISYQFRDYNTSCNSTRNRRKTFFFSITVIVAAFAVNMGMQGGLQKQNLYSVLETPRHASVLDIRHQYKAVSKKMHPDKNKVDSVEEANKKFERVKLAYDVLMDESTRDIYNRFGEENIKFDPRKDELKLMSDLAVHYLAWGMLAFVYTMPAASHAARIWLTILSIAILVVEVSLTLTQSSLPDYASKAFPYLTERSLVNALHAAYPLFMALLRCVSESLYVDVDKTSLACLSEISAHHKNMLSIITAVHSTTSQLKAAGSSGYGSRSGRGGAAESEEGPLTLEEIQEKLLECREVIDKTNASIAVMLDSLRRSSSNPGSDYYWILFVLMYVGVYFFQ